MLGQVLGLHQESPNLGYLLAAQRFLGLLNERHNPNGLGGGHKYAGQEAHGQAEDIGYKHTGQQAEEHSGQGPQALAGPDHVHDDDQKGPHHGQKDHGHAVLGKMRDLIGIQKGDSGYNKDKNPTKYL